jgi:hypothetical protein
MSLMFLRKEALKKCWSFSNLLLLPADINENYVSAAEKGGDIEMFMNVPVMFCGKGIERGVQMLQFSASTKRRPSHHSDRAHPLTPTHLLSPVTPPPTSKFWQAVL